MNKKILISLSVIAAVAAIAVGVTMAYFSDTETSTGNTFTAGSLDLKVDSTQHYNNAVCVCNSPACIWQLELNAVATNPQYPVIGTACGGTWDQPNGKDIVGEKFFNFDDVKPGDSGENTVSLHVDNNDAYICGYVTNLANNDNGLTEPESKVDTTDGVGNGELQNNILVTVWEDKGTAEYPAGECDNIRQPNEHVYVSEVPIDSNTGAWLLGKVEGDKTVCLGVAWKVLPTVGNIIQSDSVSGDIMFYAEQYRNNNPNFICPQPTRITRTLSFSPGGWAGWSCPAGTHVVGGGYTSGTVAFSGPARPGEPSYPVYPHYTYTPPETGWVIQNDNDNESITYYVDCFAN